jgi:hypothetical protein
MKRLIIILMAAWILLPATAGGQTVNSQGREEREWERTRKILECAPRLIERRELVEDQFDHRYVTNNPRDIEIGYFSVEPITYLEQARRFCEVLLPASGVSESYFRGYYTTRYELPGDGVYRVSIRSSTLIFNNEPRLINAQNTVAEVEASHHLEVEMDTTGQNGYGHEKVAKSNRAYQWNLEIGNTGTWHGELDPGEIEITDFEIPSGYSEIELEEEYKGPGILVIRESVIFRVSSVSAYKYDPIFQAVCLFSMEPLAITTRLLPCAGR